MKSACKLWIDFGRDGVKLSSAQVTSLYTADELVGRLVLAVTNFPPKRIGDVRSEVLVLGVPIEGGDNVALIGPDRDVPLGARVA